ncbi:hypothetical protein NF701_12930 [Sphingomonadaceae bacterium OTU29THOMA1]|nr:hypothetical protein NF701_12930 [Sphingomonadaceae bacterium OTU29THOMA1]
MAEDWLLEDAETGDDLAAKRHARYLNNDPFPEIEASLLGSAAFLKYIQTTAMIHPFRGWDHQEQKPNPDLVKPASYEMRPGKSFFVYDQSGELIERELTGSGVKRYIRLPANSITFVSTEETFRLPNYIAARFNLRIRHVHRGILLGTGPLIDPGYNQPILIPLHNLTDEEHFIALDEGLIWVEFTKTYPAPKHDLYTGPFGQPTFQPRKNRKGFRDYLFAAANGKPIRSSITGVNAIARRAESRVEGFGRSIRNFGLVGIAGLVFTVASLLYPTLALVFDANQQNVATQKQIDELKHEVKDLRAELNKAPKPASARAILTAPGEGSPET